MPLIFLPLSDPIKPANAKITGLAVAFSG